MDQALAEAPAASEPSEAVVGKKSKVRKRMFYAVPSTSAIYASFSKQELKKQLEASGLGLGDVTLIWGEPRAVKVKTETYF